MLDPGEMMAASLSTSCRSESTKTSALVVAGNALFLSLQHPTDGAQPGKTKPLGYCERTLQVFIRQIKLAFVVVVTTISSLEASLKAMLLMNRITAISHCLYI